MRSNRRWVVVCAVGAWLWACGPDLAPPDFESAETRQRLDELPPRARQRVSQIRGRLAETPGAKDLWRDLALTLHANGEPELAAEIYARAVELDPEAGRLLYLRCHALRDSGEAQGALNCLEEGMAAGVAYAPAARALAAWTLEAGDLELAARRAAEAERQAVGDPGVRAVKARIEMARGEYARAAEVLSGGSSGPQERAYLEFLRVRAIQAATGERVEVEAVPEPAWADPWLEELADHRVGVEEDVAEAMAALQSDDPAAAIALLESTLSWRPDHPAAVQVLALAHRRAGDHGQAIALLESAVERQPGIAEHWVQLAATYLVTAVETGESGRYRDALRAADRLRELQPRDFRGHAVAGDVLNAVGRPVEAIEAYAECGALSPRSAARCEIKAARTFIGLGRSREAADLLRGAFGERPVDDEAARLLATAREAIEAGRS